MGYFTSHFKKFIHSDGDVLLATSSSGNVPQFSQASTWSHGQYNTKMRGLALEALVAKNVSEK